MRVGGGTGGVGGGGGGAAVTITQACRSWAVKCMVEAHLCSTLLPLESIHYYDYYYYAR